MERIPRQFFTNEFKEEAVKLVVESGLTLADAGRRLSLTEYIEIFYNRQRRHAKLGNISPAEFERKLYRINQAA